MSAPPAERSVDASGRRRTWSVVLAVLASVCLATGVVASWVDATLFDPDEFAARSAIALDAEAVREQIAVELIDRLGQSDNQLAVEFRPAAIVATQSLIETDTFRTIFVSAARTAHAAILAGNSTDGLDLSDSLSLVASGLQLSEEDTADAGAEPTSSLAGTVSKIADLAIWDLSPVLLGAARALLIGGLVAGALSVYVSPSRRRGVSQLGLAVAAGGIGIILFVAIGSRIGGRILTDESGLRQAVQDAAWKATTDLRQFGRGIALIGLVVGAAASPGLERKWTGRGMREAVVGGYARLRGTTWGTIVIAAAVGVAGATTLYATDVAISVATTALGFALLFAATRILVSLAAHPHEPESESTSGGSRRTAWLMVAAVLVAGATAVAVAQSMSSRAKAGDADTRTCLGAASTCDLRLDEVTLAGSHNAMSAAATPGWLFAEHTATIAGQLDAGIRALLVDAHYGRPSEVTFPGIDTPLVITDVAAELAVPGAEVENPAVRRRAVELAAAVPTDGAGARDVYLCHNYCELGAARLADQLRDIATFLDRNPGEIVMVIVQNAVSSADIAAAFEEADLTSEVVTLRDGEPLPSVGELVDAGTQLIVFAERGDDDAPAWYHDAYGWFQETTYDFGSVEEFSCEPNRGDSDNPLFLINHWVSRSPPDPAAAAQANTAAVLDERVERCRRERGRQPNVIAADFSTSGDVVETAAAITGP